MCIQCALPVVTIMVLWQLLNLGTGCTVYIYIYIDRERERFDLNPRLPYH